MRSNSCHVLIVIHYFADSGLFHLITQAKNVPFRIFRLKRETDRTYASDQNLTKLLSASEKKLTKLTKQLMKI